MTAQEKWAYDKYKKALDSQYATAIANIYLDGEASVGWIKPDAVRGAYTEVWPAVSYTQGKETADLVIKGYEILRDPWKANTLRYLDSVAGKRITEVWNTSKDLYIKALREATVEASAEGIGIEATQRKIRTLVNDKLSGDINIWRARRIAQTEVIAAGNFGSVSAIGQMNNDGLVVKKQWKAVPGAKDPRHYPSMDGQIREAGQDFNVFGEQLEYPGDPRGSAGNVINCRCAVQPYVEDKL